MLYRSAYPVVDKNRLLISVSIGLHSYESACEGSVDSYAGIKRVGAGAPGIPCFPIPPWSSQRGVCAAARSINSLAREKSYGDTESGHSGGTVTISTCPA